MAALAQRLAQCPVTRSVRLEGGGDFLLADLGREVLEVRGQHRRVRCRSPDAASALPVALDPLGVTREKPEVLLQHLRARTAKALRAEGLFDQALRVLARFLGLDLHLRQQLHEEVHGAVLRPLTLPVALDPLRIHAVEAEVAFERPRVLAVEEVLVVPLLLQALRVRAGLVGLDLHLGKQLDEELDAILQLRHAWGAGGLCAWGAGSGCVLPPGRTRDGPRTTYGSADCLGTTAQLTETEAAELLNAVDSG